MTVLLIIGTILGMLQLVLQLLEALSKKNSDFTYIRNEVRDLISKLEKQRNKYNLQYFVKTGETAENKNALGFLNIDPLINTLINDFENEKEENQ